MKLSSEDFQNLQNILTAVSVCGIDSIIIEDGLVRGTNSTVNAFIISNFNVPQLPQKMGLSRLSALTSRLSVFDKASPVIDAKETDRGEISMLDISAGRSKVQFRCTSTMLIKAPKAINDDAAYKIFANKEELKLIIDSTRVMGAKRVTMSIKQDLTVQFDVSDSANDTFTTTLETKAEVLGDHDGTVVHNFPSDTLLPVLKTAGSDADGVMFEVGQQGFIKIKMLGHAIALAPQVDGEQGEDDE